MPTPSSLRIEIREAITVLKMLDWPDEARAIASDLSRAGNDLRELLMVRDDAERLIERAAID